MKPTAVASRDRTLLNKHTWREIAVLQVKYLCRDGS